MTQQLSPEFARYLFSEYGAWYGPPILIHDTKMIDGRTRYAQRGAIKPPVKQVFSCGMAIKLLCVNGHHERACELYSSELSIFSNSRDLAAFCHCPPELVAPIYTKHDGRHPRTVRSLNTRKRRDAIARLGRLLKQAEETTGTVTCDELRAALAPWI